MHPILQTGEAGWPATFCTQYMSATIMPIRYSGDPGITGCFVGLRSREYIYISLNKQRSIKNNIPLTVNIIFPMVLVFSRKTLLLPYIRRVKKTNKQTHNPQHYATLFVPDSPIKCTLSTVVSTHFQSDQEGYSSTLKAMKKFILMQHCQVSWINIITYGFPIPLCFMAHSYLHISLHSRIC